MHANMIIKLNSDQIISRYLALRHCLIIDILPDNITGIKFSTYSIEIYES